MLRTVFDAKDRCGDPSFHLIGTLVGGGWMGLALASLLLEGKGKLTETLTGSG